LTPTFQLKGFRTTPKVNIPENVQNSHRAVQIYARLAAVLLLLTMIGGGFGEVYMPSQVIVPGNAEATADNLREFATIFRMGFAAYLLEAVCDIALSWVFYVLLAPVNKPLALLATLFGLVSTSVFAAGQLFCFAPSFIVQGSDYLKAFSPDQQSSLALLSFKLCGSSAGIFMLFYGIAALIRGYLIIRSGYLPRLLGYILILAGAGFVTRNLLVVLSPANASDLLLLPMFIALSSLMVWLFARGVNLQRWEASLANIKANLP
jgi:hypothetical protein